MGSKDHPEVPPFPPFPLLNIPPTPLNPATPPPTSAQGDQRVDPQIRGRRGGGERKGEGRGWTHLGEQRIAVVGKTSRTVDGTYLLSLPPLIKRAIDSKESLAG